MDSLEEPVRIVPYEDKYQYAFKSLNEEWIKVYFEIEEADRRALDNPRSYILDKGGKIFVALYGNKPVGVCSLMKMDHPEYQFEMAKMAVSPAMQGKKIGRLLVQAVISAARSLGAEKIFLESNTVLQPAISLYRKMGFTEVTGMPTPYTRCNIQMELVLNP
jgi:GNAT superfamily N-acetyltransferase